MEVTSYTTLTPDYSHRNSPVDKISTGAHNVRESHTETEAPMYDLLLPVPAEGKETTWNDPRANTRSSIQQMLGSPQNTTGLVGL